MSLSTRSTLTLSNHSAFRSVPTNAAAPSPTASALAASGGLRIAADQHSNVALARQLVNHLNYLCYQLPRFHKCGHPVERAGQAANDLLLSVQHINRLGYGVACDAECAVDYSRRTVDPERCPLCVSVEDCFSVVLKQSCGHLAAVMSSAGPAHVTRLGANEFCDARCRTVQIDQDVGGACLKCSSRHCHMIWESYRCGHSGGVLGQLVIGSNHLRNFGHSFAPCDARCRFSHKKREVGERCIRCKPMHTFAYHKTFYKQWRP